MFADAGEAFAVVHHECAAMTYSIAHEIGHIIGARHEPSIDKTMVPFPYGAWVRQRNQMAGHHELQGELWWMPASAGVVQPEGDDHGRARRHART